MTIAISYFAGAGWQFFDNNGVPLTGGLIYTYAAGTTTPQATYTSNTGGTAQANPIVLDSAGRVPNEIWLTIGLSYKFVLKDSNGVQIGSYDNLSSINDFTSVFTTLATSSGSSLIGYTQGSTNAVATTVQSKLREVVSVKDFGAKGDGTTDDTTAIQNAIDYAASLGGGTVYLPAGNYVVSQLQFKSGQAQVIIEGQVQAYTYSNYASTSVLTCTTGVWAIRFTENSSCCGLRNIGINSNGGVSTSVPYIPTQYGVEYGVLIETGPTYMENVTVYGFQYGCTIANAGNSNLFLNCAFAWNTKVGFAVTIGSAQGYALYHPNLTPPSTFIVTTIYTMRNCNLRRNAWGMVLRDGAAVEYNTLCESNVFGGRLYWVGSIDNGVGGNCYNTYLENNWLAFTPTLITWYNSAVVGNNYLKNNGSNYIALTDDSSNALSDFGYQITMGSAQAGTTYGPQVIFNQISSSLQASQKGIFAKQTLLCQFNEIQFTNGDQTNLIRLGYATGGFLSNATQFININGTPPPDYGNRGILITNDRSSDSGGLTMNQGFHRGLAGTVSAFATPTPTTITTATYTFGANANDVYSTSFIANYAGTVTLVLRPANETTYTGNSVFTGVSTTNTGRWLYLKTITANTVVSASANVVPLVGGAAGTAILPATAGAWAALQSDGTNWIIMARGS